MATGNNPKRPELTASELSQIDAVCDRFESAWESGRAPEIAPYLAGIEEPLRSRLRKELEAVSAERKGRRAQVMDLERFARLLLRSGLMTAEQLEPFLDKQPKDAQALARELFRSQKLTEYQAKTILRGKTKELVFGDYVVLVTNDSLIHVIDSEGKVRSHSLTHGLPAGEPVVDGAHWLLASSEGTVWRIDPASGEELASLDTGLALGSGLADYGRRLLAAGHDGTLYVIEKP